MKEEHEVSKYIQELLLKNTLVILFEIIIEIGLTLKITNIDIKAGVMKLSPTSFLSAKCIGKNQY